MIISIMLMLMFIFCFTSIISLLCFMLWYVCTYELNSCPLLGASDWMIFCGRKKKKCLRLGKKPQLQILKQLETLALCSQQQSENAELTQIHCSENIFDHFVALIKILLLSGQYSKTATFKTDNYHELIAFISLSCISPLQGPLVRWLKVNFSEAFIAWIHIKALRVFVESVLRYCDQTISPNSTCACTCIKAEASSCDTACFHFSDGSLKDV